MLVCAGCSLVVSYSAFQVCVISGGGTSRAEVEGERVRECLRIVVVIGNQETLSVPAVLLTIRRSALPHLPPPPSTPSPDSCTCGNRGASFFGLPSTEARVATGAH